jgi:hypothetical protein
VGLYNINRPCASYAYELVKRSTIYVKQPRGHRTDGREQSAQVHLMAKFGSDSA